MASSPYSSEPQTGNAFNLKGRALYTIHQYLVRIYTFGNLDFSILVLASILFENIDCQELTAINKHTVYKLVASLLFVSSKIVDEGSDYWSVADFAVICGI